MSDDIFYSETEGSIECEVTYIMTTGIPEVKLYHHDTEMTAVTSSVGR